MNLAVNGASHASSIRFRIDGFPRNFPIDEEALAKFMERRAPGRDALSTARHEPDKVELKRCGETVEGIIRNTDMRPQDYGSERTIPRPGHADFGQWVEMGRIPTGGGKNSGRMTAALCAAGGICKQLLEARGLTVEAQVASIGKETDAAKFEDEILAAKRDLDSVGGTIRCCVTGMKAGVGGALFDGLESAISQAIFAIPGVKGIEFGNGFEAARMRGSENNDAFVIENGEVRTATDRHGGILGGRSTGMPIEFTVAMKPTPTIYKEQDSVDLATMRPVKIAMKGRHDPCIVRRAVPVVEAMAAFVLADAILADEAKHLRICLTLTGKTLQEDLEQYRSQRYFTDMVELRADLLEKAERAKAALFPLVLAADGFTPRKIPVVLTFRRKCDGGAFEGKEAERIAFFRKALAGGAFAYVDFEDDFRDASLERLAKKMGTRIVRSLHSFDRPIRNVIARCHELIGTADEIAKISFMPKSLADVARLFREAADFIDVPHVVCAMGPMGLATRALAGRTHSMWTYASAGGLESIGHITPHEIVRTYRFRSMTREAALYGVTGWPLKATRSPELNNLAWSDEDENKIMVPMPAKNAKDALAFFRTMRMSGMAVTIPHKQTIMPLLDKIDKVAKAIGAVNTVVNENGKLVGYNTDSEGFGEAIRRFVGRDDFKGMKVAVLGAGGASKAVVFALKKLLAKVEICHRTTPPQGFDLIVNATPVDPIPEYAFTGKEMVYDLVYVPAETPLMARARAAGCKVENGLSMLIAQAAAQRRLWR